ncbi:MAG: hypothetical protein AB7R69_04070 [Candidatus Babeliales bacterium]
MKYYALFFLMAIMIFGTSISSENDNNLPKNKIDTELLLKDMDETIIMIDDFLRAIQAFEAKRTAKKNNLMRFNRKTKDID